MSVKDIRDRRCVTHFETHGKGDELRHVAVHPAAAGAITAYLEAAAHDGHAGAALVPVFSRT